MVLDNHYHYLLCKLSNEIDELACYDIVGTTGVAAELSHVSMYIIFRSELYIIMITFTCHVKSANNYDET